MRVIINGAPQEMRDDYARRMIEQGRAMPAPPAPAAAPEAETPKNDAPKGKRRK